MLTLKIYKFFTLLRLLFFLCFNVEVDGLPELVDVYSVEFWKELSPKLHVYDEDFIVQYAGQTGAVNISDVSI